MGSRRMFSKQIVCSDAFLDLPVTAQALYFQIAMEADDDGFTNNPRRLAKLCGASVEDIRKLVEARFLLSFPSGIVCVKHWWMHNTMRKDRYKPTVYSEEYSTITVKGNGSYTEADSGCHVVANWLPTGCHAVGDTVATPTASQVKLSKDKVIEVNNTVCTEPQGNSVPAEPQEAAVIELPLVDKTFYSVTQSAIDGWMEAYPAVDVLQQLRSMKAWLDGNPGRKKTRRGIKAFIVRWLSQEQDKGGGQRMNPAPWKYQQPSPAKSAEAQAAENQRNFAQMQALLAQMKEA